ncbi:hypothetical protein HK098_006229 [Nowakowskiella sp. JEL0407]|nr:hypothetical protein HK098_006229 [Nowakowskiella sp. JEL0407]
MSFAPFGASSSGKSEAYVPGLPLTATEASAYAEFFKQADVSGMGLITTGDAVNFLKKSLLPPPTLNEIWNLVDPESKGVLNQGAFFKALKLISLAQSGKPHTLTQLNADTPLPIFEKDKGFASPSKPVIPNQPASAINPALRTGSVSSQPPMPMLPQMTGAILPQSTGAPTNFTLSVEERSRYMAAWNSCSPVDGMVTGDTARDLFLKSGLSIEILGKIWTLVDSDGLGKLTLNQFMIAMSLIMRIKMGSLSAVPASIPPALFNSVVAGNGPESLTSPVSSTLARAPVPTPAMPVKPTVTDEFVISAEEKKQYNTYFDTLDITKSGFISGEQAYGFMTKSKLPNETLGEIWALSDTSQSGKLNREEFAIAMFLIKKVIGGTPLPSTLPPSLAPTPTRSTPMQDLVDLLTPNPPKPTESLPNLMDNLSAPIVPQISSSASILKPPRSSFGYLSDTSLMSSISANPLAPGGNLQELEKELEQRRNELLEAEKQFATVGPQAEETKKKRADLEAELKQLTDQKHEMTIKISSTRAVMEAERKIVAEREAMLIREKQMIELGKEEVAKAARFVDTLTFQKQNLVTQSEQNNLQIGALQQQIKEYTDAAAGLNEEVDKLKEELNKQLSLIDINQMRLQKAQEDYQGLLLESQKVRQQVEQEKEKVRVLSNQAVKQQSEKMQLEKDKAESLSQLNILQTAPPPVQITKAESNPVLSSGPPPPIPSLSTKPSNTNMPKASSATFTPFSDTISSSSTTSPPKSSPRDKINSILELSKQVSPSGRSKTPTEGASQQPSPQSLTSSSANPTIFPSPISGTTSPTPAPALSGLKPEVDTKELKPQKITNEMSSSDFAATFPDVEDFESGFPRSETPLEVKTVASFKIDDKSSTVSPKLENKTKPTSGTESNPPPVREIVDFDEELKSIDNTASKSPPKFDDKAFEVLSKTQITDGTFNFDDAFADFDKSTTFPPAQGSTAAMSAFDAFNDGFDPFAPSSQPPAGGNVKDAFSSELDDAFGGGAKAVGGASAFDLDTVFGGLSFGPPKPAKAEDDDLKEVKELMGMGFTKEQAVDALEK